MDGDKKRNKIEAVAIMAMIAISVFAGIMLTMAHRVPLRGGVKDNIVPEEIGQQLLEKV